MADSSIVFDFSRTPDFIDNMNIGSCFQLSEMDGTTKNFEFVLATSCPDNIEDCLDANGGLNNSVTVLNDVDGTVALNYSKTTTNNNRIISMGSTAISLDVGPVDTYLKALFLRQVNTGYVLAYSILARTVPITNEIVLPASGVIWTIRNEV